MVKQIPRKGIPRARDGERYPEWREGFLSVMKQAGKKYAPPTHALCKGCKKPLQLCMGHTISTSKGGKGHGHGVRKGSVMVYGPKWKCSRYGSSRGCKFAQDAKRKEDVTEEIIVDPGPPSPISRTQKPPRPQREEPFDESDALPTDYMPYTEYIKSRAEKVKLMDEERMDEERRRRADAATKRRDGVPGTGLLPGQAAPPPPRQSTTTEPEDEEEDDESHQDAQRHPSSQHIGPLLLQRREPQETSSKRQEKKKSKAAAASAEAFLESVPVDSPLRRRAAHAAAGAAATLGVKAMKRKRRRQGPEIIVESRQEEQDFFGADDYEDDSQTALQKAVAMGKKEASAAVAPGFALADYAESEESALDMVKKMEEMQSEKASAAMRRRGSSSSSSSSSGVAATRGSAASSGSSTSSVRRRFDQQLLRTHGHAPAVPVLPPVPAPPPVQRPPVIDLLAPDSQESSLGGSLQ